jgi:hypothetical protein
MGVSVPQMPRTTNLRVLFFVFVCYCFAMSTVFQAFFTSFFVSPGSGKEIANFDELMHSDLIYGEDGHYEEFLDIETDDDTKKLKLNKFSCPSIKFCLRCLCTEGDIRTLATKNEAEYPYLQKHNAVGRKKSLCTVKEEVYQFSSAISSNIGFPLPDRFNVVLRCCMECGPVDKYWSEMKFVRQLKDDLTFE